MTVNQKPPGDNGINPQLAEAIENLSEERQLNLLKQLLQDDITTTLFGLIQKISPDEQLSLLQQLQEDPITSSKPEETEIALRSQSRKSCMINVDYTVEERNFEGFILDISPTGAFIETGEAFSAGQRIQLTFSLPNVPGQMNVAGEILWTGKLGIGLHFIDLSRQQLNLISAFVENK